MSTDAKWRTLALGVSSLGFLLAMCEINSPLRFHAVLVLQVKMERDGCRGEGKSDIKLFGLLHSGQG